MIQTITKILAIITFIIILIVAFGKDAEAGYKRYGDRYVPPKYTKIEGNAPIYLQKAFQKLRKTAGFKKHQIKLRVNYRVRRASAYISGNGSFAIITISRGELHLNEGYPEQMAFIIAHEIGHFALGHLRYGRPNSYADSRRREKAADLYGKRLMGKAGYNVCAAGEYWKRIMKKYGNRDGKTHPKYSERYRYLRCGKK